MQELGGPPKYEKNPYGVHTFHEWLMFHEKCTHFSIEEFNHIFQALEFSEKIHQHEFRKVS